MPQVNVNGVQLYYEEHGIGPQTMFFIHGFMLSGEVFRDQFEYFKARYKCVVFDLRGQGRSEVTDTGYEIDSLTTDAVSLIQTLGLGPCHVVGISTGGAVALRMASRHRELLKSLILIDTSAESEQNKLRYNWYKTLIQLFGMKIVVANFMRLYFSNNFLSDPARQEDVLFWKSELLKNKKTSVKALKGHINRESVLNELDNIPVPTLVMVGDEDAVTPPQMSKNIKLKIPQARLATIQGTGHLSTIEDPWQVIETIEVFLNGVH